MQAVIIRVAPAADLVVKSSLKIKMPMLQFRISSDMDRTEAVFTGR